MRSVGVTITVDETTPATMPDAMDWAGPSVCVSGSSNIFRILSKATKRMASLPIEPFDLCQLLVEVYSNECDPGH